MGLISKLIPSLVGGVSQQPAVLRLENQCELMENALPSIVHGLEKRPGSEFLTQVTSTADGNVHGHLINRDTGERYIALFTGDSSNPIEIYTVDGTKCTVQYGDIGSDVLLYEPSSYSDGDLIVVGGGSPVGSYGDKAVILQNTSGSTWGFDRVKFKIVGLPFSGGTNTLTIRAQNLSGSVPNGTDRATGSMTVDSTTTGVQEITLSSSVSVTNGSYIALVFDVAVSQYWAASFRTSGDSEGIYERAYTINGSGSSGDWSDDSSSEEPIWVELYEGDFTENTDYKEYFSSNNPKSAIRATTVADYTIVTNKGVYPAKSGSTSSAWPEEALIWVKQYVDDTHCSIFINGTLVDEGGGVSGHMDNGATNRDAVFTFRNFLHGQLETDYPTGWTFTKVGVDMIHIVKGTGDAFELSVSDGYQGEVLKAYEKVVQKFSDLPPVATDGFIMEVSGDASNKFDNYYVQYSASGANDDGTGVWNEIAKPGIDNGFDQNTMPHKIVRTAANTFTVSPIYWEERSVGDEDSSPDPSFIGAPINSVFFFNNRLGLLTSENVVLSCTSDFFNFYRGTVLELLDTDIIDQAVSSNEVANLKYSIAFQKDLLIFSDQQQFLLSSEGLLTPSSVSISQTTRFETSDVCAPVGIGPNVYFTVPKVNNAALREYFVQPDSIVNDAADVTAHIPNYIPADVNILAGSASHDIVLVGKTGTEFIYVYKMMWNGAEKVQSAWGTWELPYDVLWFSILDNFIYVVGDDGVDIVMEKIDLEKANTGDLDFRVHLDRLEEVNGGYGGSGITPFTMSYVGVNGSSNWCVVHATTGEELPISSVSNAGATTVVYVTGVYTGVACHIGIRNTMRYRFSELGMKAPDGSGVDRLVGNLKIKTVTFNIKDTGYFKIEFTPAERTMQTHEFDFETTMTSKEQRVFVRGDGKDQLDIVSNSYLPCSIQAATYEGKYFTRSSMMG